MDNIAIELDSLTTGYGNKIIIEECSVKLNEKSITALLGANGQGKTTLIKSILNYLKIKKGNINVYGKNIKDYSVQDLSKIIAYVPQSNSVHHDIIARDYIVEGRTPYLGLFSAPQLEDYIIVEKYSEMLGIANILGSNIQHLSGGQLQMVMIARALVQETPIVIMDEPMAALDLAHQVSLMKIFNQINALGKTILFTTHNPNHAFALKCNVWIMNDKKIVRSGKAEDALSENVLKAIYGNNVLIIEQDGIKSCTFKSIQLTD